MRLSNGLPEIPAGVNVLKGLRGWLNYLFSRCVVRIEGGDGIEVTEYMPGHYEVSRAADEEGAGGGGSGGAAEFCTFPETGQLFKYDGESDCLQPTTLEDELKALTGYSAASQQVLGHDSSGNIQWYTTSECA